MRPAILAKSQLRGAPFRINVRPRIQSLVSCWARGAFCRTSVMMTDLLVETATQAALDCVTVLLDRGGPVPERACLKSCVFGFRYVIRLTSSRGTRLEREKGPLLGCQAFYKWHTPSPRLGLEGAPGFDWRTNTPHRCIWPGAVVQPSAVPATWDLSIS